ncbi:AER240Wp [Eremothecium gossypii ATCC 10895]|uniref:AER240Wp n=1 Tax=Eremothecium gossypii (strain ATCC 10895 / CBS 109.51 / FGSC 9923 / NRRL Y-1056) TaxID=284811 RepID=Q756L4_EREGS|nr:AER240Wp [Eremothecium gossypii ATCC 10895]AAS52921.1 AER240Wp [Eremothecium gossypii ATCC 10895]AEY97229.1 FAER240Wp [Eremothecium gossypii FDAG1]
MECFDPLDFLSSAPQTIPPSRKDPLEPLVADALPESEGLKAEDNGATDTGHITVLDLPHIQYADPSAVLAVLLLLQPTAQVNFVGDESKAWQLVAEEKHVAGPLLDAALQYYRKWGSGSLSTEEQICSKIPVLLLHYNGELLRYYLSVLSHYEVVDHPLKDEILKQTALRISERCGRTAQPAITRQFLVDGVARPIVLHEPALTSDNLGLKTWGASLLLSRRVAGFTGKKRVLELGAGTGLVGIAYALANIDADDVFVTDLPEIVPNLRHNLALNNLTNVRASVLDWSDPTSFLHEHGELQFDAIFVADPIYSPNHPQLLVQTVARFLAPAGTLYLEIPIRAQYATERRLLWDLLAAHHLKVICTEEDRGNDDWGEVQYIYKEVGWSNIR